MAESNPEETPSKNSLVEQDLEQMDCPVCLQPFTHPVELPCRHIFCYLCVKGVANRSKKCALCRTEIPADYLFKPSLVRRKDLVQAKPLEDGQQWFYEGNRGWWQYDERTSIEIESKYKEGADNTEVLIAGFLYIVDFKNMIQYRRNDPSRCRRIKRDVSNIPKKGIAGISLRLAPKVDDRPLGDGIEIDTVPKTTAQPLPASSSLNTFSLPDNSTTTTLAAGLRFASLDGGGYSLNQTSGGGSSRAPVPVSHSPSLTSSSTSAMARQPPANRSNHNATATSLRASSENNLHRASRDPVRASFEPSSPISRSVRTRPTSNPASGQGQASESLVTGRDEVRMRREAAARGVDRATEGMQRLSLHRSTDL